MRNRTVIAMRVMTIMLAAGMCMTGQAPVYAEETNEESQEAEDASEEGEEEKTEEKPASLEEDADSRLLEGQEEEKTEETEEKDEEEVPAEPEKEILSGWQSGDDGKLRYFDPDSHEAVTGLAVVEEKTYLFDEEGNMLTGAWRTEGGMRFFDLETGIMRTCEGWCKGAEEEKYYADRSGYLVSGQRKINGKYYLFSDETYAMLAGPQKVNGKWYYFDTVKGEKKTSSGWAHDRDSNWYYAGKNGVLKSGWQTIKKKKYYFDPATMKMAKGAANISGKWYFFDVKSGAQKKNGWGTDAEGKKYYADKKGFLKTGWQTISKKKYYFDPETKAAVTGLQSVSGKAYFFADDGAMKTGWAKDTDGIWYYGDKNGVLQTGWRTVSGKRYYLYPDFHMQPEGEAEIDGTVYVFAKDGSMTGARYESLEEIPSSFSGTAVIGEKTYLIKDGQPQDGWTEEDSRKSYVTKEGEKAVGFKVIGNRICYFDKFGAYSDTYSAVLSSEVKLTERQKEIAEKTMQAIIENDNSVFFECEGSAKDDKYIVQNILNEAYLPYGQANIIINAKFKVKNGKVESSTMYIQNPGTYLKAIKDDKSFDKLITDRLAKSGANSKKSVRDKVKAIDNYICRTMKYDMKYLRKDVTAGIRNGRGVCDTYAHYFYYMCRKAKIPVRIITGYATGDHAWNQVKVNGKWLYIDSCWNDAGSKSNRRYYLSTSLRLHKRAQVMITYTP